MKDISKRIEIKPIFAGLLAVMGIGSQATQAQLVCPIYQVTRTPNVGLGMFNTGASVNSARTRIAFVSPTASEESAAVALSWLLKKQVRLVALMLSIAVLGIVSMQRVARADDKYWADKYWIDQEVDCKDFCSSNSAMHWGCAVGYNFSGGCVLPAIPQNPDESYEGKMCRLVGYCYNKEKDEQDRQACDERRKQWRNDCPYGGDFSCSNAEVWGYECKPW